MPAFRAKEYEDCSIYRTNSPPKEPSMPNESFKKRHPTQWQIIRIGAGILSMPVIATILYAVGWLLFPGLFHLGMKLDGGSLNEIHTTDQHVFGWLIGFTCMVGIIITGFIARWFVNVVIDGDKC